MGARVLHGSRWRKARGQAIIEMALVLPILLLLVFGVCDFGVYMFRQSEATNCVREVARRAAVWAPADQLNPPQCAPYGAFLTKSPSYPGSLKPGDDFTARIDMPFDPVVIDNFVPPLKNAMWIITSVTMRMEGTRV